VKRAPTSWTKSTAAVLEPEPFACLRRMNEYDGLRRRGMTPTARHRGAANFLICIAILVIGSLLNGLLISFLFHRSLGESFRLVCVFLTGLSMLIACRAAALFSDISGREPQHVVIAQFGATLAAISGKPSDRAGMAIPPDISAIHLRSGKLA
jgi:hypothetical protein